MDKHPIDDLFKGKLSQHPVSPGPEAWGKLEAKFAAKPKPFYLQKRTLGLSCIAASLLLLLGFWWAFQPRHGAVDTPSEFVGSGGLDSSQVTSPLQGVEELNLTRNLPGTASKQKPNGQDLKGEMNRNAPAIPGQQGPEDKLLAPEMALELVPDSAGLPKVLEDSSQLFKPEFLIDSQMLAQENPETKPEKRNNYTITVKIKLSNSSGLGPASQPQGNSQGVLAKLLKPDAEKAQKRKLLSEKIFASLGK